MSKPFLIQMIESSQKEIRTEVNNFLEQNILFRLFKKNLPHFSEKDNVEILELLLLPIKEDEIKIKKTSNCNNYEKRQIFRLSFRENKKKLVSIWYETLDWDSYFISYEGSGSINCEIEGAHTLDEYDIKILKEGMPFPRFVRFKVSPDQIRGEGNIIYLNIKKKEN